MVSDKGYNGLIIKIQMTKVKCQNQKIYAEAGVKLDDLVKLAVKDNLTGLEWAAGIPGTVGGALYGNAAAFLGSMADVVEEIECAEVKLLKELG